MNMAYIVLQQTEQAPCNYANGPEIFQGTQSL
jgi:hypothetical protein